MHRIEMPLVLALTSASLFAQSAPVAVQPLQAPQADRFKASADETGNQAQKSAPDVWLGLSVQPRKDGAPRLEILEVIPGSPASRAQIQSGDVLVALAGKPVKTHDSLLELLRDRRPGDRARLTVERSSSIVLGESTEADHHALLGVTTSDAK